MAARRMSQFKRSMVRRWLFSYLAACMIPFLLATLFCLYCTRMVVGSAVEGSRLALQSVSRGVDMALRDVETVGQGLLLDDRFLPYAGSDSEPTSMEYYQATGVLRSVVPSGPIGGAMVFNPKIERYIGQEQWGNFTDFYLRNEYNLDLSRSEINSIFGVDVRRIRFSNCDYHYAGGREVKRLLVIKPLNYARGGKLYDWYLACIINLDDMFAPVLSDGREFVVTQDGKVLYSFFSSYEAGSSHPELLDSQRIASDYVERRSSDTGPYTYVMLTDRKVIFRSLRGYFVMVGVLLAVSLAIAVFLLHSRLRRDWASYEDAIKASGTLIDQDVKAENEYLPFVSTMQGLVQQKEGMSLLIKRQSEAFKQHTLSELVAHGEPVSLATLGECGITLKGSCFIVVLFVLSEGQDASRFEEEMVSSLSGDDVLVLPFDSDHGSACILNSKRSFDDSLERRIEELGERNACQYSAASTQVDALDKLGEAYLEAINVLEYEKARSTHEFLTYSDVRQMTSQINFTYTTEQELALGQSIRDGKAMESVALVEKIFSGNQNAGASPKCLRYLLFAIASTAYRTASTLDGRYTDSLPELTLPPIIQGDNLERSRGEVEDLVQKLCLAVAKVNSEYADASSKSYAVYQKALDEVQAHYAEQSLNVSQLADTLGVSIVYLSRTFKKYHTTNISDYIARYRLYMSKKLLSEGMKVSDVALACGFGSLRTYLRVFKQFEHVTPGQYRSGSSSSMEE